MSNEVEIQALRPFNRTPQGDICDVGDRFTVGAVRAAELERLGLAARPAAEATDAPAAPQSEKSAPEPENKMAPATSTKRGRKADAGSEG